MRKRLLKSLQSVGLILAFFAVYELLSKFAVGNLRIWIFFLPPSEFLRHLIELFVGGEMIPHIAASFLRVFVGFFVGALLGAPVGLLCGWYRRVDLVFGPLIDLVRTFPKPALFPILILVSGIGEISKVALIVFGIFFIVCLNSMYGARGIDRVMVDSMRVMGATNRQIFWKVVLPSALPYISAGVRISLGVSLTYLTFAEMLAAERGLGYLVLQSQRTFAYDTMLAATLTLCLLGGCAVYLYLALERRVLSWHFVSGEESL